MFIDATEAVKSYAASQNLTPAFNCVLDGQIGHNAPPPTYQQAIVLQVSTVSSILFEIYNYNFISIPLYSIHAIHVPDLYIKLM